MIRKLRHDKLKSGALCKRQHAVGGVTGLYLQCIPPVGDEKIGSRQWILRTTIGSKRKEIGLGGYPSVPAKNARAKTYSTLNLSNLPLRPASTMPPLRIIEVLARQGIFNWISLRRYSNEPI